MAKLQGCLQLSRVWGYCSCARPLTCSLPVCLCLRAQRAGQLVQCGHPAGCSGRCQRSPLPAAARVARFPVRARGATWGQGSLGCACGLTACACMGELFCRPSALPGCALPVLQASH
jgi:hypothetical protein